MVKCKISIFHDYTTKKYKNNNLANAKLWLSSSLRPEFLLAHFLFTYFVEVLRESTGN